MAAGETTRELNLKLQISADPSQGSKALAAIAADAKRAEEAAGRAGKAIAEAQQKYGGGFGSPAGGGGGASGGGYHPAGQGVGSVYDPLVTALRELTGAINQLQKTEYDIDLNIKKEAAKNEAEKATAKNEAEKAASSPGLFAGMGSGLTKLAGGIAAVGFTAEITANLAKSVQQLDNPMLTAREKTLGLAESIPVLGSALASLTSNVMNAIDRFTDPETAKKVDRLRYEQPIILGRMAAQSNYETREWKLQNEVQSAQFRAEAIRVVPHFDYAMQEFDKQFRAESLAMQRQFPRGAGINRGFANPPSTRTLEIPGMPSITLPGMAGMGMNPNEGGLDTLWHEQPGLHSAFEALQTARRNADMAERQAKDSAAAVAGDLPGKRMAERTWKAAVRESERRLTEAKRGDFDIGVSAYDKMRGLGRNQAESLLVGSMGWLAPEWSGANKLVTGRSDRASSTTRLEEAGLAEQRALLDLTNSTSALEAKMAKSKEDQLNFTRQKYAVSQAETGLMQQQLSIIDSQIQKTKSGLEQFGSMDKFGQMAIVSAAERLQKQGRQGVTQEEFGLLRSNQLTAEWAGRWALKDAAASPLADRLFDITGQQKLSVLQQDFKDKREELTVKVQMDEVKLADAIALQMKESNIGGQLAEIVKLLSDIAGRKSGWEALQAKYVRSS